MEDYKIVIINTILNLEFLNYTKHIPKINCLKSFIKYNSVHKLSLFCSEIVLEKKVVAKCFDTINW